MHQKIVSFSYTEDAQHVTLGESDLEFKDILSCLAKESKITLTAMACLLQIDRSDLSRYIHGHAKPSRQIINEKGWRSVFQKTCPEEWTKCEVLFEQTFSKLPALKGEKPNPKYPQESEKKNTFGHTLWLIIGGETANVTLAARLLKIDQGYLSKILHGRLEISQAVIAAKEWEKVFRLHYSMGWRKHRGDFRKFLAALPIVPYARKKKQDSAVKTTISRFSKKMVARLKSLSKEIGTLSTPEVKCCVGEVVDNFVRLNAPNNGDIEDGIVVVARAATDEILRDTRVWRKIRYGSNEVGLDIYKAVLGEICKSPGIDDEEVGRATRKIVAEIRIRQAAAPRCAPC